MCRDLNENISGFDPDVYRFYCRALEGAGFSAPFSPDDLDRIREAEISGHVANFDPYDFKEMIDIDIGSGDGHSIPVRLYIPESAARSDESVPVLLYFHGGGFIMGSIEDHDPLCARLADELGAIVAAVEYRLAPEYPFPACIEDAVSAAEWVYSNIREYGGDPDRMMAGGDSSGANISAALALLAGEGKAPRLSYLILFYGIYGCIDIAESESGRLYGNGRYVLPLDAMSKMMELYIPDDADENDIRLYPGKAADLSCMPPSIIVTAEFDPLRDDGEEFARRLEESGCDVRLIRMDGMMHGFMVYWQKFERAGKLLHHIGRAVKEMI